MRVEHIAKKPHEPWDGRSLCGKPVQTQDVLFLASMAHYHTITCEECIKALTRLYLNSKI